MPDGRLAAPRWGRVTDVKRGAPPKPWPWEGIIDTVRRDSLDMLAQGRQPRTALVAEYKSGKDAGGRKARTNRRNYDAEKLREGLDERYPLERWKVMRRFREDSWYVGEIWVRYEGTLTPEQDREDRVRRRRQVLERQRTARENRERRAPGHVRELG